MLQHDPTSPSPHNLIHGIYGTKGSALFDPPPPRICTGNRKWASRETFESIEKQYTPEICKTYAKLKNSRKSTENSRFGYHDQADQLMTWHLVDCLRNGLPLDQDVYDAAAWSAIVPLSEWSVQNNSNSIKIPDFTSNCWKINKQNMDVNLTHGGTTRVFS